MSESTPSLEFRTSDDFAHISTHGLLALVVDRVKRDGFFASVRRAVTLKMKKRTYSVADKLLTLWCSILVGCNHTVEINTKLGAHEQAAAALFGLERFPDQSQISRLLSACTAETVAQMRHLHRRWMRRYSRAGKRRFWRPLSGGKRVLVADVDQRALAVSGKQYELAAVGHFTRKRGKRGYQLSLCYLGGAVGEVLDEFFDPGNTPAGARLDDLLESLAWLCDQHKIARRDVVIRGDAAYGAVGTLEKIAAYGFSYFLKGISPTTAARLEREHGAQALAFTLVHEHADGERLWLADLGALDHEGAPLDGSKPTARARTLLGVRVDWRQARGSRPGKAMRERVGPPARHKHVSYEHYLTNLPAEQLALKDAYGFYVERVTIERYFNDEQNALGARYVRTHHTHGAAVFQWMVAMASNQLRRLQRQEFAGTGIDGYGLKRLVHTAMQVPAIVERAAGRLIVTLPKRHEVVRLLLVGWKRLDASGVVAQGGLISAPAP